MGFNSVCQFSVYPSVSMGFSVYPWDSQYIRQDIHGIRDSQYIHEILCISLSESIDSHFDLIVNMHGFGEEITAETCLQTPMCSSIFACALFMVRGTQFKLLKGHSIEQLLEVHWRAALGTNV